MTSLQLRLQEITRMTDHCEEWKGTQVFSLMSEALDFAIKNKENIGVFQLKYANGLLCYFLYSSDTEALKEICLQCGSNSPFGTIPGMFDIYSIHLKGTAAEEFQTEL
jgi:hypothetical protein